MSPTTSVWRNGAFVRLWVGESVSLLGSRISQFALPLVAILLLNVTPWQMGLLQAAQFIPLLLISLFAGVWIDRVSRRTVMIVADLASAASMLAIPFFYLLNLLSFELLCLIAFLTGVFNVLFAIAYQSYLPTLLKGEQLVDGNGLMEISQSVTDITGASIGGILVQIVSAPLIFFIDAFSCLFSCLLLLTVRVHEVVATRAEQPKMRDAIAEGLRFLLSHAILRAFTLCNVSINFFGAILGSAFTLYAIEELAIEPSALGVILSVSGVGGLVGAIMAGRVRRYGGFGIAITGGVVLSGVGALIVPLAGGSSALVIAMLMLAQFIISAGSPVYRVNQISLRQTVTPDHLQGRVNASMRFVAGGVVPLGSLIGGALGTTLGLRFTLLIAAIGMLSAALWLFLSPVRTIRHFEESSEFKAA